MAQVKISENKNRKLILTLKMSEKEREDFCLECGKQPQGIVSKVVIEDTNELTREDIKQELDKIASSIDGDRFTMENIQSLINKI